MQIVNKPKDSARLRRIALAAQGLLQAQPYGSGLAGARQTINHLGYIQIDTISVVERAHHHVLYSRVSNAQPDMLNQLLLAGDIFEYWSHAAAFLPISDFRFSLPYKQAIKSGQTHWYKQPDQTLMAELLARITSDGPLRSRDLESQRRANSPGWWDWKPAKKALEQLYMQGDLMVSQRDGFQKVYDLTERVLPSQVNTQMPSVEEFASHLIQQQLRCHGLISLKGVTYLRRNAALRKAVKAQITEQLHQGQLESLQTSNGETFMLPAGALDQPLPRLSKRLRILSPFDNSVIQRDRLKALFHYDYQIECYVPAAKRQYGYFCLPLLYGDEFIGQMDCKAHRKQQQLEIKALYLLGDTGDPETFTAAFASAMGEFCRFQQCNSLRLSQVQPTHLGPLLQPALSAIIDMD